MEVMVVNTFFQEVLFWYALNEAEGTLSVSLEVLKLFEPNVGGVVARHVTVLRLVQL